MQSIHAFNRFEEKRHAEPFQCHSRLLAVLLRDVLYMSRIHK